MLEIGRIVRPHGLKGQVIVELWTDREERLDPGVELAGGPGPLIVGSSSRMAAGSGRDRWIVAFEGVETREAAESLRDTVLLAEPMQVEGVLWVHELVGADLFDPAGQVVGKVEAVEANPASDLLVLEDGRVIPLTFVSRDERGELTVDGPPGLLDL